MARKVVIVGFPGVQALDVVGPHDVFAGASLLTNGGYNVVVGSIDGQPISTATGLAFVGSQRRRVSYALGCRIWSEASWPPACNQAPTSRGASRSGL